MIINPRISALPAYNSGLAGQEFERLYGRAPVAKLDSNETPFGTSPHAITAGRSAIETPALYPDGNATSLRQSLAAATGIPMEQILLGNGSEELIYACYAAVLSPGEHVLTVSPGFGLHSLAAQCLGNEVRTVSIGADWRLPIQKLTDALQDKQKIFAISTPSNPIGTALSLDEVEALVQATPAQTLLLLDEAYFEFNPIDTLKVLQTSGKNWLSLRTFSKAFGLAGLRIGYGLCSSAGLRNAMRHVTTPFNANAVAQAMAQAAFADTEFLQNTVSKTHEARDAFVADLIALGFAPAPSRSNAVFVDVSSSAQAAAETLRHEGILVKAWQETNFESFLRVSVGTKQNNKAFSDALIKLGLQPAASKPGD